MELKGTIKKINELTTLASGFQKRELILTTEEQYPQSILIEFLQDKADVLNNYKEGQGVKVGINLRGREWTNPQGEVKYFNSIVGWKIEAENTPVKKDEVKQVQEAEIIDDLPF